MFPTRLLFFLLFISVINERASALRALAIFPFPSKSHAIGIQHLFQAMARRGHSVDLVSHFPRDKPMENYRDISLRGILPSIPNSTTFDMFQSFNFLGMKDFVRIAGAETCDLLELPVFQELMMTPRGTYDVIIIELFVAPCYVAFGEKLNAPVVGAVTSKLPDWLFDSFGNPLNPSYMASYFSSSTQRMTFWERLRNTLHVQNTRFQFDYYMTDQIAQVEKHFARRISSLDELYKDVALVLVNEHFSVNDIKPTTPDIIDIGGLHIYNNTQQLTTELQDWLDESTEGCVYFTFGSTVNFESFPKEVLRIFYRSFERIAPVRVLMKGDPEVHSKDLSKNVKIVPWAPQIAVLKHKNVKAFITHGGLLGTQEAIAYKVPLIGIPLFGDQYPNLRNYANRGFAVVLELKALTEDSLTDAIITVLRDPTYSENIARVSELFWDRPMNPLDTAIYWIEYAAKRGLVLKSPATELSWWKLHLLDVYGFMLICALTVLYAIIKLTTLLCSCASRVLPKKVPKSKKHN
ncbi:UDP-glucuronosyltransferase 2B14 [Fopius arisanus]|uniref:UDP-glucuronosyltransferase n=1 Tax=Fopius arisanus TaxID=64838 RepID=A0A9R1SUC3_9HYME|nr:PREDICTED: UDP-glucuronosyltransferase 2B14-like [Fopius arisanus]